MPTRMRSDDPRSTSFDNISLLCPRNHSAMRERPLVDPIATILLDGLVGLLGMLPVSLLRALGSGLGRGLYYTARRRRTVAH